MKSKKISDIFGLPNEGVHKYRFLGLAAVDLFATVALAALLTYWTTDKSIISFFVIFIILMILSIYIHKIFDVKTALVKKIFD
jgi:hypothetical protein